MVIHEPSSPVRLQNMSACIKNGKLHLCADDHGTRKFQVHTKTVDPIFLSNRIAEFARQMDDSNGCESARLSYKRREKHGTVTCPRAHVVAEDRTVPKDQSFVFCTSTDSMRKV